MRPARQHGYTGSDYNYAPHFHNPAFLRFAGFRPNLPQMLQKSLFPESFDIPPRIIYDSVKV